MADIAADYARAIEKDIGEPVMLHGFSTGSAVALQLAIDHPQLVRRLVLAPGACRLSQHARQIQAEFARLTEANDVRRGWALLMGMLVPYPIRYPALLLGWLAGRSFAPEDPADMLVTLAAEDSFDAEQDLHRVLAPTLVLGGTADPFYSEDLFRRTANGIPGGTRGDLPRQVTFLRRQPRHPQASPWDSSSADDQRPLRESERFLHDSSVRSSWAAHQARAQPPPYDRSSQRLATIVPHGTDAATSARKATVMIFYFDRRRRRGHYLLSITAILGALFEVTDKIAGRTTPRDRSSRESKAHGVWRHSNGNASASGLSVSDYCGGSTTSWPLGRPLHKDQLHKDQSRRKETR